MALFSKFAKSHAKQINKAQRWIDSAQAQFATAIEDAQTAEDKFNEIAQDKQKLLDIALEELNEATEKARQAEHFKNKIKSFIE